MYVAFKDYPSGDAPQLLLRTPADKEILTPPPLRGDLDQTGGTLSAQGILVATNRHRAKDSLPPLKSNFALNQVAQKKLNDMFALGYFDHVNPNGIGPADIVEEVGYDYLRVGENLALGGYNNDADLVQAWMDSPEHRANIMAEGFTELGIAASQSTFESKPTWIAVQTFGLPSSACPTVDSSLQNSFQRKKIQMEQLETRLADPPTTYTDLAEQGQAKIEQGNDLTKQGNELAQQQKSNQQAQALWDQAEQLQQEGQSLIDQAQTKSDAYNDNVTTFNQLNQETISLVDQINSQVKAHNDCVSSF